MASPRHFHWRVGHGRTVVEPIECAIPILIHGARLDAEADGQDVALHQRHEARGVDLLGFTGRLHHVDVCVAQQLRAADVHLCAIVDLGIELNALGLEAHT